jgi:pentapeptide repeat protein
VSAGSRKRASRPLAETVDWLKPDPLVQALVWLLAPILAVGGVLVAILFYAFTCCWCHYDRGLFVLPPFLLSYALLCRSRRRAAIGVGICCWAWPRLCYWEGFRDHTLGIPTDPKSMLYAIVGFVFASNAWLLARWLWRLPLPRRRAGWAIGSLGLGTAVLLTPYWPYAVARFHGHSAHLRRADLARADLRCVDLRGADLRDAEMRGASLFGADLTGADLAGADLTGAAYAGETRWPAGFFPEAHGAVEYEFM